MEGYTQKWNYTVVGARRAYHYNGLTFVPQLDPYGGLMLGYNIVSYSATGDYTGPNAYGSGLGFSLFVGSRWFFSDNLAAGLYRLQVFNINLQTQCPFICFTLTLFGIY